MSPSPVGTTAITIHLLRPVGFGVRDVVEVAVTVIITVAVTVIITVVIAAYECQSHTQEWGGQRQRRLSF
jgi:hypothetical protein